MIIMILHNPLTALFVTIASFLGARALQQKWDGNALLNPAIISILSVVVFLTIFDIPYAEYSANVDLINAFLGPAIVALAIPLYHQITMIKKAALAIFVAVGVTCIVAAFGGYQIAHMMGAIQDIQLAIMTKSVTTPITIGIAETIGAKPSLAILFVFVTGISGCLLAKSIFQIFRITNQSAQGFALGVTCHALGVATALQINERAGAFAALGMSLMGIISGILLPILILWLII